MKNYGKLISVTVFLLTITLTQKTFADDMEDVEAVVYQYGALEDDLAAQAELMTSDRIHIANGNRQTDQARNAMIQIANRTRQEELNGGKTTFITSIEDVEISIFDDVAIASFKQWWNILPANQANTVGAPQWVTLVLVKEGSDWLIKHTHQSQVRGN